MTGQRAAVLINVAQVLRRPGVQHPLRRTLHLDELRVGDASVPEDRPVELDLVMESTGSAVVVTGTVSSFARCNCRRCLEPFDDAITASVREIFDPRPVEGETYPLTNEHIDVVPLVRDAVLLSLPLAPLCRPSCPGPAPERFPALVDEVSDAAAEAGTVAAADGPDEDDSAPPRDPRWAALDQLQLDR